MGTWRRSGELVVRWAVAKRYRVGLAIESCELLRSNLGQVFTLSCLSSSSLISCWCEYRKVTSNCGSGVLYGGRVCFCTTFWVRTATSRHDTSPNSSWCQSRKKKEEEEEQEEEEEKKKNKKRRWPLSPFVAELWQARRWLMATLYSRISTSYPLYKKSCLQNFYKPKL